MIRSITITNNRNESITMELNKPTESGFVVVDVGGLGPVQANINTTEIVSYDGSVFNTARGTERNITFSLTFMGPDIEEIRHTTYRYFPLKQPITIVINTDKRSCRTTGYVESNEPTIFSSLESASISIICPNSWFEDASDDGLNEVNYYGIDPMFEFPFSNESLTEKLINFGEIRNSFEETFYYYGEVETGFTIRIHALGDIGDVTIYNADDSSKFITIDSDKLESLTGSSLIAGDDIVISTVKGHKSAQLIRNAVTTNILNCLGRNLTWFELMQGENKFAYTTSEGSANLQLTIEVQNLFQGV